MILQGGKGIGRDYANKFDNLDEMEKFLKSQNVPILNDKIEKE